MKRFLISLAAFCLVGCGNDSPEVAICPIHQQESYEPCNYYGLKAGGHYPAVMNWPYPEEYKYLFPENPFR